VSNGKGGRWRGNRRGDMNPGAGPAPEGWPPRLPPWADSAAWRAVTAALDHHLELPHIRNCPSIRRKAAAVVELINRLDTPMAELARETCCDCPDPCCARATLWYDTADLLVMGLTRSSWPAGQPMAAVEASCRYLGPRGCRLPRRRRPWICTWYRCPRQTARLDGGDGARRRLVSACLRGVKRLRKAIEGDFMAATLGLGRDPEPRGAADGWIAGGS
jgi:hypothetical protein